MALITLTANNDTLIGAIGDTIYGFTGNDTLIAGQDSILYGGKDNDSLVGTLGVTLYGGQGSDSLMAGLGNNQVFGGAGGDSIFGANGEDSLYGDEGSDTLIGGRDGDVLTGGAGSDFFVYTRITQSNDALGTGTIVSFADLGVDTIIGFESGVDKIVIEAPNTQQPTFFGILLRPGEAGGVAFVTSEAKAGSAAALLVLDKSTGTLYFNENGPLSGFGTGGKFLVLPNITSISSDDFLFI